MNAMAPPRPTELDACGVRLTAGPAAAAQARRQVRAAIRAWRAPVDPDVAVLLTSDLVTNAIRPGLMLVATLSDEWGSYRTPDGTAAYFTLAFHPDI